MKLIIALAALLALAGASSAALALHAHRKPIRVAVYRGPASCDDCSEALARAIRKADPRYRVDFVGPRERDDVDAGTLRRYQIYVQPGGGQDIDAALEALGPRRVAAIRAFVAGGGGYLGLCMGAYLADRSDIGLIADDLDSEVRRPGSSARSEDDTVVPVRWAGRTQTLYYQDGPFLPAHADAPDFRRIATYRNGDIAAARYASGRGTVVLSGPHPEADDSWFDEADLPVAAEPTGDPIKALLTQFRS